MSVKRFIRRLIVGHSTLRRLEEFERQGDPFAPYCYIGNGVGLVRLHDGHVLYVKAADVAVVGSLLRSGRWALDIEALLRRLVRPGHVVVNVGAHVGYFSVILAGLVGPTGRLLAIEPQAELADLIKRSLYLNGYGDRSEAVCCAVGPNEGSVSFAASEAWSGGGTVVAKADVPHRSWQVREVPQRRLDDIVRERAMAPVDLILMDTEGYEPLVLAGCPEVLASPSIRIVAEFSRHLMSRFMPVDDFSTWLQQHGFQVWEIGAEGALRACMPAALPDSCDILLARGDVTEFEAAPAPSAKR